MNEGRTVVNGKAQRHTGRCRASAAPRALAALLLTYCLAGAASAAGAVTPAASWSFHSLAIPTEFSPSQNAACQQETRSPNLFRNALPAQCDFYRVTAADAGSRPTDGSTVTLTDTLPAGTTLRAIQFLWSGVTRLELPATTDIAENFCVIAARVVTCELPFQVEPDDALELDLFVTTEPGASGSNTASISGGGAAEAATSELLAVGPEAPPFGIASFSSVFAGLDGAPDTEAAGHPYELTVAAGMNSEIRRGPEDAIEPTSVEDAKDVVLDLPPGMLGSGLATPTCTLAQLSSEERCPPDTRVGEILTEPRNVDGVEGPVYNVTPERGVAAELGFRDGIHGSHIVYVDVVPTPQGYVLRAANWGVPQISLTNLRVVFYGDPVEKDHSGESPTALFTNPADCNGAPLAPSIHMDSWQRPGRYLADGSPDLSDPSWGAASAEYPPVAGCDELRFTPSLGAQPETSAADSPSGLSVDLQVPQQEQPGTRATPPLRDARVTLPPGVTINPAAASGLSACSEAQIGWQGTTLSDFTAAPAACPESSKVGAVEVQSPLIGGTLVGSIYLAKQEENPFHGLLAAYLVVDDPVTGVIIKVPGDLTLDPSTGQITATFEESPQFPFSDLRLHIFGGPRAPLATPPSCGAFTTASDLMPWSAPDSGPDATPASSFQIETGCQSGFAPGFAAGSQSTQAGAYSPFAISISRDDAEQNLGGVALTLPEGSLGKIAGIPLCPDAQASAGACPAGSQVGTVLAGAGVGQNPYFVSGKVYLTGPYNGGPFGLVEEVPAVAGPFNLGMVVVRQSLRVNPVTGQVTAVSDPLPTILDGIPLHVRRVDVVLNRPDFTFNPTSCTPTAVTGTLTSTQGASANVSSRFQVGGCRELPFKPVFKVSTQGKTSKQDGASLLVTYTSGPGQANTAKVAVTLPKQLPSRLTTIQQACTEQAFAANPSSCPAGSNIGTATASTPVLAKPLSGPVYLVSHGGAAFPDVVAILQGEGVTLDLTGSIDIKHGITSSAFETVPDAPIDVFQMTLPEGPHSALTTALPAKAKGDLCGTSLTMPTKITGQNGAQINQSTKIAVTGCAKAKPKKKSKHPRRGGKKHR